MRGAELTAEERERLAEAFVRVPYARLLGLEFVGAERAEDDEDDEAQPSLFSD